MALEQARFFNSTEVDPRRYSADNFAEYFRMLFGNGVQSLGTNLQVSAGVIDMSVSVNYGQALIDGYAYFLKDDGSGPWKSTLVSAPQPRFARIVLHLDKRLDQQGIRLMALHGAPATSPQLPALTNTSAITEISLARIYIPAGAAQITVGNVIDERNDAELCGRIKSPIDVDTVDGRHASDFFPSSGGTIAGNVNVTGDLNIKRTNASAYLNFDANAGQYRLLQFKTDGKYRFVLGLDTSAETGSNAGSNLFIAQYDDNGNYLGSAISINRATGSIAFEKDVKTRGKDVIGEIGTYGVPDGVLITTDIASNEDAMFRAHIYGNTYGVGAVMDIIVEGYQYMSGDAIINVHGTTIDYAPMVYIFDNSGFLCFWIPPVNLFGSAMAVVQTTFSSAGTTLRNRVTSVVNSSLPSSRARTVQIQPRRVGIYESSNNANGYYVKYPDGTMIAWGSTGTGSSPATINFPATFSDYPVVVISPIKTGGAMVVAAEIGVSHTQFAFERWWAANGGVLSAPAGEPANWNAIGRWY